MPDPRRFPLQWELLDDLPVLVAVVTALAAVAVFAVVDRLVDEPRLSRLDGLIRFERYLPRLVSVAVGLALAGTVAQGAYLAPSMSLPDGPPGLLLGGLEVLAAGLLVTGVLRLLAALAIAVLAFSEKLLNPELALSFLGLRPGSCRA